MRNRLIGGAVGVGALCLILLAGSADAVTVTPYFDPSITTAANAKQIESAVNAVTAQYSYLYNNPVAVNIYFQMAPIGNALGTSSSTFYFADYNSYSFAAFENANLNPNNAPLNQGLNTIFFTFAQSNVSDLILGTSANFRANGFDAPGGTVVNGVAMDAVITLSSNASTPIDYGANVPAYNGGNLEFNGRNVIEHEVDEVLGSGGAGSALNFVNEGVTLPPPYDTSTYEGVLDRFRYSAPDTPGFSTDPNDTAYFSLDGGATDLTPFNQNSAGDFGDLGGAAPCSDPAFAGGPASVVQDAFSCNNTPTSYIGRGDIEDIMLQSIGWDPTPEPATWVMMLLGVALTGAALRRQGAAALVRV